MLVAHIEVHRTELREDRYSEAGSIGRCLWELAQAAWATVAALHAL